VTVALEIRHGQDFGLGFPRRHLRTTINGFRPASLSTYRFAESKSLSNHDSRL